MTEAGYYRFPTIHQDTVVFVCEDDLWAVPVRGGSLDTHAELAEELQTRPGEAPSPEHTMFAEDHAGGLRRRRGSLNRRSGVATTHAAG